jgi:tetratricopeptide (TPR) repeat protein
MEQSPAHARAAFALGIGFESRGELESALDAYERAAALKPRFAELHARIGALHYRLGDAEAGRAAFRRSVRYSASRHDALYNQALAQQKAGRTAEAIETLNIVITENPNHAPSLRMLEQLLAAPPTP